MLFNYWQRLLSGSRNKFERCRINAVTEPCWSWTIVKNMSQVSVAFFACNFGSGHAMTFIENKIDTVFIRSIAKSWPSAPGIIFLRRCKQNRSASNTGIFSGLVKFVVFAGKRSFCSLFACYMKLHGCKNLLPLLIGLYYFICSFHNNSF